MVLIIIIVAVAIFLAVRQRGLKHIASEVIRHLYEIITDFYISSSFDNRTNDVMSEIL